MRNPRKEQGKLREGDIFENTLITRVLHVKGNTQRSVEFLCTGCKVRFKRTLSNQKRSPTKTCNKCSKEYARLSSLKYKDIRHSKELYRIWKNMNARCHNPSNPAYEHYGGRGIEVDYSWREINDRGYYNFLDHVYPRPSKKYSLERVNGDKGYSRENVIWATQKTQMNNIRTNRILEWKGESYTLQQLAEIHNIKSNTLLYRLKRGWTLPEALEGKRFKSYTPPFLDKVNESTLYTVMSSVENGSMTQTKASDIIGVDSSNISRTIRKPEFIRWMRKYEQEL